VIRVARALLAGGWPALAVIAAVVCAQRLVLPLAALRLDASQPAVAAGALLGAAALGFVRARAADRLAGAVRLNLVELYLAPFERGPAPSLPPSEVVAARLSTALPMLVSAAVDGVAPVLAALAAAPAVIALLAHALGAGALVPLGVAGAAGAGAALLTARGVTAVWNDAWERARVFHVAISAAFEGAVDLRAHGRASAFAARLRDDVRAWSVAEGRARLRSTASTWGAFGVTLIAGAAVISVAGGALSPRGDLYRTSLLVLTAIPTFHTLVGGLANLVAARSEIDHAARQLALAAAAGEREVDEPIEANAEIALENVGYAYPDGGPRALDDLSLTLPPGKSLAVLGPNGAGKTTLLHLLMGVVRPDRGRVLVDGREARLDNRRLRARIAYLSQRPFEVPEGTIADNLRALDPAIEDARLLAALDRVGLLATLRRRAGSDVAALGLAYAALSRGQARRVMLARALLRDADLLLLDEPEAHLDAAAVADLAALLRELARERRVIAAVHDRDLASFADAVLELGPPRASS
jgi:ABC-type transport system involved in cytochrome bd biosynthesis fused ATPase/permease subunit